MAQRKIRWLHCPPDICIGINSGLWSLTAVRQAEVLARTASWLHSASPLKILIDNIPKNINKIRRRHILNDDFRPNAGCLRCFIDTVVEVGEIDIIQKHAAAVSAYASAKT